MKSTDIGHYILTAALNTHRRRCGFFKPLQMKDLEFHAGFTLIELLVVISIIAILIGILLPTLSGAKTLARITKVHADLRSITTVMESYRQDHKEQIPPTRFSCSTRSAYELPVELLSYLPQGRINDVDVVMMPDPFSATECYKYRAVGPAIINESTMLPNAATLWVPDGFPGVESDTGSYHDDPSTSPVRYAVYSMGPDPETTKFDIPGRLPLPKKYWLNNVGDTGVIVHFEDRDMQIHMSP